MRTRWYREGREWITMFLILGLVFPFPSLVQGAPPSLEGSHPAMDFDEELAFEKDLEAFTEKTLAEGDEEIVEESDSASEPLRQSLAGGLTEPQQAALELESGEVMGNSLEFGTGVSLATLPGHNALAPDFQLSYSNQGGQHFSGVGWSVSFDYFIEMDLNRSTLYWSPKGYYRVNAPGVKGELVYSDKNSIHERSRIGNNNLYVYFSNQTSGPLTKFIYNAQNNEWLAAAPDGKRFYFGNVEAARVTNNCSGDDDDEKTLRWYLTKIEDEYGNKIEFSWELNLTCDTDGVSFRWFEPLLDSIKYAHNGNNYHRVKFEYVTEDADTDTTWNHDFWIPLGEDWETGAPTNSLFRQKMDQKLKRVRMQYCPSGSCRSARSLQLNYTSEYDNNEKFVYLESVRQCGNDGSCLPETKFIYSNKMLNGPESGSSYRLRQIIYPGGGSETITYAHLLSPGTGYSQVAIFNDGRRAEDELDKVNPIIVVRKELCRETSDTSVGDIFPCNSGENGRADYETRFYCLNPYFNDQYKEFRGCEQVEIRQVKSGEDTRLPGGKSILRKVNVGREDEEFLLKGFVHDEWVFNHTNLVASTCNPSGTNGCAWNNTSVAIQKVTNYPEVDYIFCHKDVEGKGQVDCVDNPRSAIAMVHSPVVRTDVYDQNGVWCDQDKCRATVIQKKGFDLGTSNTMDEVGEDETLNLTNIQFYRIEGAAAKELSIGEMPNEDDLEGIASSETAAYFYYKSDPNDQYGLARKLEFTQVVSSNGRQYAEKYDYDIAPNGMMGNRSHFYVYAPLDPDDEGDGEPEIDWNELSEEQRQAAREGAGVLEGTIRRQTVMTQNGSDPGNVDPGSIPVIPDTPDVPVVHPNRGPSSKFPVNIPDGVDPSSPRVGALGGKLRVDIFAVGGSDSRLVSYTQYDNRGLPVTAITYFTTDESDSLTINTTYDDDLDLYPVKSEQTYSNGTVWTLNFFDVSTGLLKSSTVSSNEAWNGAYYDYDTFGRLEKSWDRFTSENEPLQKITYDPNYKWIKAEALTVGGYVTAIDHYDGLGRVWAKSAYPYDGNQYIYTAQEFNEVGQVVKSYHPKTTPSFTPPSPSGYYTETQYDPLGRPNLVISADGAKTESKIQGPTVVLLGPDVLASAGLSVNSETATYLGHVQEFRDGFGNVHRTIQFCKGSKQDCAYGGYPDEKANWQYDYADPDAYDYEGTWRGVSTEYEYEYWAKPDGSGVTALLTRVEDPHGNETFFTYDTLGRRTWMSDPDAGISTYEYDLSGNLVKAVDARGVRTESTYKEGFLLMSTVGYGSSQEKVENRFGEDSHCDSGSAIFPNMLSSTKTTKDDNSIEVRFCYDQRGRVIEKQYELSFGSNYDQAVGSSVEQRVTYSWTIDDQISAISAAGKTITYSYCTSSDSDCSPGQLRSIAGSDGTYVKQIVYNERGQMIGVWNGDGRYISYEYDPKNLRLTQILTCRDEDEDRICDTQSKSIGECHSTSTVMQDLDYSYRPGGDIYRIMSVPLECADVDGDNKDDLKSSANTTAYEYDGLSRLISAERTALEDGSCVYEREYAYDMIGNMIRKFELCRANEKFLWSFFYENDHPHQLSTVVVYDFGDDDDYERPEGGYSCDPYNAGQNQSICFDMEYDAAGNMTVSHNPHTGWYREMNWTSRGQMQSVDYCPGDVSCDGNHLEFLYDNRNLRYFKYQPQSVKTDFNEPSWSVYIDKLLEFGVRDQKIDLTGDAIQVDYANLHVFMGGIDPSTGEVAPGTRRVATIDNEDGSLSAGLALNTASKPWGCSSVISRSNENSGTGLLQLILMLLSVGFVFVIRRRRYQK